MDYELACLLIGGYPWDGYQTGIMVFKVYYLVFVVYTTLEG